MRCSTRLICLVFIAVVCLIQSCASLYAQSTVIAKQQKNTTPQILILNSYEQSYLWTRQEMDGLLETLKKNQPSCDPMVEYLDWKRYPDQENLAHLVDLFHYRYSNQKIDIIVVTDNAALDFAVRYREKLFSNAPIIFCGINGFSAMKNIPSDVTGVAETINPKATLDIAFSLHPHTKTVAVVVDSTETGMAIRRDIESVIPSFKAHYSGVSFQFLQNVSIAELGTALERLPKDSFVYMVSFNRDRLNHVFCHEETLKIVADHSKVPVYHSFDWALGKGIVGGALISGKDQGRYAAEMAIHVLNGEDIRRIPVMRTVPTPAMFDYRQMKRFGIEPSNLPQGSRIINQPFSLYAHYKGLIWAVICALALLTGTVITLSINIAHRKRAEEALRDSEERYRLLFENNPDIVAVFKGNAYAAVSPSVASQLGYERSDVVGKKPWDLAPEFQPDGTLSEVKAKHFFKRAAASGVQLFNWTQLHKDGSTLDLEVSLVRYEVNGDMMFLAICRDITERNRAIEKRRALEMEMEKHKRQFYRETILSVTEGKLDVTDTETIEPYISSGTHIIEVSEASQVSVARRQAEDFCRERGIDEDRLNEFIIGVGEAVTNAVKHSDGGLVHLGESDDTVWVVIEDTGKGIDSLILPSATLRRGFSTKPSMGLGYSIILDVADRVLLKTDPSGTTVVLIKNKQESDPDISFYNIPDTWDSISDI